MKLRKLVDDFGFELITKKCDLDKEISGLHCCDLLSWVMANAKEDEAWITVQTHANIIAVATLLDMSCLIIPSSIEIDQSTLAKANDQEVAVFSTSEDAYGIFKLFYEAGMK